MIRLSADALAGLSLLMTRPVAEAGDYFEVRRAGEILRVVEAFLRHQFHAETVEGAKSLERFLRRFGNQRRNLVLKWRGTVRYRGA